MIYGVGIDEIEVARVATKLERTAGLKERLFTEDEIRYCESKRFKAQHFAARFAAKEAFFKALGTGWSRGFAFVEIEIVNDNIGKPACLMHGKIKHFARQEGIVKAHVSMTHLKETASAMVVLEKE